MTVPTVKSNNAASSGPNRTKRHTAATYHNNKVTATIWKRIVSTNQHKQLMKLGLSKQLLVGHHELMSTVCVATDSLIARTRQVVEVKIENNRRAGE